MANYERDRDDARVYDGSEDDEDGEGSHLPVVIIITILVLAAFGGVVWLAYNQGVARGRNEPVRIATTDPGAGGQIKVYQQAASTEDDDSPQAATSKPAETAPPAMRTETPPAQVATPAAAPPQSTATPIRQPATPKPQAQAAPPAKSAPQTTVAPTPLRLAQAATAEPAIATKPPAQLGLARPAPVTANPPAARPVATAKPAVSKSAPGSYLLQIGAYKSETEAMAAWKTYQSKHAALLAGFSPDVQRADLGEKGVWQRLRIASFADKDAALALCERLKAQNGACFLAH
jgi:hypothetical protein